MAGAGGGLGARAIIYQFNSESVSTWAFLHLPPNLSFFPVQAASVAWRLLLAQTGRHTKKKRKKKSLVLVVPKKKDRSTRRLGAQRTTRHARPLHTCFRRSNSASLLLSLQKKNDLDCVHGTTLRTAPLASMRPGVSCRSANCTATFDRRKRNTREMLEFAEYRSIGREANARPCGGERPLVQSKFCMACSFLPRREVDRLGTFVGREAHTLLRHRTRRGRKRAHWPGSLATAAAAAASVPAVAPSVQGHHTAQFRGI